MLFRKITVSLFCLLLSAASFAQVTVIVHPSNANALTSKDVQRIFLGKDKKFPDGSEIIAINLEPTSPTRTSFDESVLGRSTTQVAAFWSKLVFTGRGIPPKEVATDAEVLELIANNPSVIGYIDSSSVNDTVKVIAID